ncbi:MAG: methyltransferase domain-containing protein [Candidatus Nanoarchaeia archaeon]
MNKSSNLRNGLAATAIVIAAGSAAWKTRDILVEAYVSPKEVRARLMKDPVRVEGHYTDVISVLRQNDLEVSDNRYSGLSYTAVFNYIKENADRYLGGLNDKVVVEIGPGASLAHAVLMGVAGIKEYHGVELYTDDVLFDARSYRTAIESAQAVSPRIFVRPIDEVIKIEGERADINKEIIKFHVFDTPDYDLLKISRAGSADIVYSRSVLEHVEDPKKSLVDQCKLLKVGGIMIHDIDLRDHRDFTHPLEFLKYSQAEWEEVQNRNPVHGRQNRVRASEYRTALADHFRVLRWVENFSDYSRNLLRKNFTPVRVDEETQRSFDPYFQEMSREDLSVTNLSLVVRKVKECN